MNAVWSFPHRSAPTNDELLPFITGDRIRYLDARDFRPTGRWQDDSIAIGVTRCPPDPENENTP